MQEDGYELVRLLADRLEECWHQPDAGLWESRGEAHQHTYSKVMCWVAFDRASCWFAKKDRTLSRRYRQLADQATHAEIGRASWRERVCKYVSNSVVAVAVNKKHIAYNHDI